MTDSEAKAYYQKHPSGGPAEGAANFIHWAMEHFEVRWLTCWTGIGFLGASDSERLADILQVSKNRLASIVNPDSHNCTTKTTGIDFTRDWVWVEDELSAHEFYELQQKGCLDRFFYTDSSKDKHALTLTQHHLAKRYNLSLL
jgi:hypothetical protein